ncbi:J domain-containing protein [Niabella yanshanensis]|uniref:J domain-containing protein n=1 Tax=Niabella yanshanensis TaxID=577386 RepID=A0ABZ0WCF3_9BACT|nr:J domain-containing protein [Niabella yanshanensis]WQD40050.1 J domain-containing protein [Niabella yanshanensis]
MPGTLKNYYEILGVPRSATADQIRIAYRKLLLKFHPDKNVGDTYFEEWSKKINEAFEVLMNPEVRSEYDLVYDEARAASRPTAAVNKDAAEKTTPGEGRPAITVDASIQKLAPVYVSARQAYIKAARNVAAIEARLKVKRTNTVPHFISGGILILVILVWVGVSNKHLLEKLLAAPSSVVDQASVLPLRPKLQQAQTPVTAERDTEQVPINLRLRVVAAKAYFFEEPGGAVLDDKFLSKGNKIHALKRAGNFYYGVFQSAVNSSYKIEGWLKTEDVEILAQ